MFAQCKDNVFFLRFSNILLSSWLGFESNQKTLLEYLTIGKIYHGNSDGKLLVNITAVFALVLVTSDLTIASALVNQVSRLIIWVIFRAYSLAIIHRCEWLTSNVFNEQQTGKFSNWENTFAWNHLLWLMETKLIY